MARPAAWFPLLVALTTAALATAAAGPSGTEGASALACWVGEGVQACASTPCPADDPADMRDACSSACPDHATISLMGGYTTGSGTVRLTAGCGDQAVASCEVHQAMTWCTDLGPAADGPLWCASKILSGSPEGVYALCST